MTNEEAIKTIISNYPPSNYSMLREGLDLAISALEKQIPKDVGTDGYGWYECPDCHNKRPNWLLGKDAKWCPYCGQHICWEAGE